MAENPATLHLQENESALDSCTGCLQILAYLWRVDYWFGHKNSCPRRGMRPDRKAH